MDDFVSFRCTQSSAFRGELTLDADALARHPLRQLRRLFALIRGDPVNGDAAAVISVWLPAAIASARQDYQSACCDYDAGYHSVRRGDKSETAAAQREQNKVLAAQRRAAKKTYIGIKKAFEIWEEFINE